MQAIIQKEGGFVSLAENCRRRVLDGTTTMEEVRRVVSSVDYE